MVSHKGKSIPSMTTTWLVIIKFIIRNKLIDDLPAELRAAGFMVPVPSVISLPPPIPFDWVAAYISSPAVRKCNGAISQFPFALFFAGANACSTCDEPSA